MKEERDVMVVACGIPPPTTTTIMASPTNFSPLAPTSFSGQSAAVPTPSPFSFSVASTTRRSSRPSIHFSSLLLRLLSLVFSFISALSMAATSPSSKMRLQSQPSSFSQYPELLYCFVVAVLAFVYSAFQLSKGVCDVAHRGMLISDSVSDYVSFILDQLVGYLLISSSSTTIPLIQHMDERMKIRKAAIVSTSMSFVTFIIIVISGFLSGYKLCKRIIW